jgi:multiple sugar transport system substrate-binding protein
MNNTKWVAAFSLLTAITLVIASCAAPTPQVETVTQIVVQTSAPVVQTSAPVVQTQIVEVTAAPAAQAAAFVTWFQYDQGNVDPKSDERVGNEYLRKAIPAFNQAFAGKWAWDNQFTPWDRQQAKIIAAVQANAEVPDLLDGGSSYVNAFYVNGTAQDLTDWAKAQAWWSEMDPNAIASCTGPDGKLYCIPMAERPSLVYAWKDRFPNGFPKTPEEFLAAGEALKKDGKYAMTYFGSTAFDGDGATRAVWQTMSSFGGTYDDGKGHMLLNTPENVAALTWLREMVQKKYVPDIAFAGGFQEEEAFKDSSAGSIPTGLFGYRYINPLTAPNGTKYSKGTSDDMIDAIAKGDVILAPFPAPAGKKPGCNIDASVFFIPVGAKNVDAAHDYINWLLNPSQNTAYVVGPGAGFPVLKSVAASADFQTPFYKEAGDAIAASSCRPFYGSLLDPAGAKKAVMEVVYNVVKKNPTADIAQALQKAQDDYNKTLP